MTLSIIIFGLLYIAIGAIVLAGVTLHDIKEALWLRGFRKHPNARRYRQRPQVFLESSIADQQFDKLRRHYRKLSRTCTRTEYILHLSNTSQPPEGALQNAVMHLNDQHELSIYELPVALVPVVTLRDLLNNYHTLASDLFRKSRAGLGVPQFREGAALRKSDAMPTRQMKLYATASSFVRLSTPIMLVTTTYAGIVMDLSELLLVTLGSFGLFMVAAIWWHDQLSFTQKLGYALLLPITLWYFAGVSIEQSLKILAHVSKAVFHSGVSLFVRVKDILRIVE